MARTLRLAFGEAEASFSFKKLERARLYGRRRRYFLDPDGEVCQRAKLTLDGTLLLKAGMTGVGYIDQSGSFVERDQLIKIDANGQVLETLPSTLDSPQPLEGPVEPQAVLDLIVNTVHQLEPVDLPEDLKTALDEGKIYRFAYSYGASTERDTGFLIANTEGYFAIIGAPTAFDWVQPDLKGMSVAGDDDMEDDLDFDMF